jgi:hypothetical protein
MMISMPRMLLAGVCLGLLAIVTTAGAQPSDNSHVSFNAGGLLPKKPNPRLPDLKAEPLAWPRLDPGAVLCQTEADLEKLTARRRGESVEGPIDCQIIRVATAVSIIQRKGPGREEVKTADPTSDGLTGWTDAWLPDKRAIGATPVSR